MDWLEETGDFFQRKMEMGLIRRLHFETRFSLNPHPFSGGNTNGNS
jgi:hypothetical protein